VTTLPSFVCVAEIDSMSGIGALAAVTWNVLRPA
jgi:hypothetical protein